LGHDRKDVGMMIKTFCTVFKGLPKEKQPGLILKTSMAGFSVTDREQIEKKITQITNIFGEKCPPIHLLFGDLTEKQMSSLYHHPKVKTMLSFTKGEGYGRPLCEFSLTGKPIIVPNWSGHVDFLPDRFTELLEGEIKNIHESAADQFLLKEAKWFYVDYSKAAAKLFDVNDKYKNYLSKSKGLRENTKKHFDLESMHSKFADIMKKYVTIPEFVALKLPEIKKL
jgi:glycosyltransferase involved in cell wall biosynthesis